MLVLRLWSGICLQVVTQFNCIPLDHENYATVSTFSPVHTKHLACKTNCMHYHVIHTVCTIMWFILYAWSCDPYCMHNHVIHIVCMIMWSILYAWSCDPYCMHSHVIHIVCIDHVIHTVCTVMWPDYPNSPYDTTLPLLTLAAWSR